MVNATVPNDVNGQYPGRMINERKDYVTENRCFKSVVIKKGAATRAGGRWQSVGWENHKAQGEIERAFDPTQNEEIG